MSTNFTGVTFAKQKVTPSYDGIVRRALLTDGTLTGCDMSYSGSTLTMAAGQLMICGRQIVHPSSQNWAVTEQTSGYARLVITIDLTRTSTKDNFDQVVDTIQYATSVNGFPALEQSDINTSGTKYQVAACVVSLGTGGITGIVSKLEKSDGGAGLNFKVVGGTTAPGSPTENTIWVNTSVAIPSWAFSAEEPGSPVAGMVWISTGTSSTVAFNALKKNAIQVYPATVKQYVSGAWVAGDAEIYQGGEWKSMITYLYNNGDECETITGGWDNDDWSGNGSTPMTAGTKNTDHMLIGTATALSASKWFNLATKNKIHLTQSQKTIYVEVTPTAIYQEASVTVAVCSTKTVGSENAAAFAKYEGTKNVKGTIAIDVSDLAGDYYVACYNYVYQGVTRCAKIHRIWMQ